MEIVTRKEAAAAGLNKYFTGHKCKNGHVDLRYTASGSCQSCIYESNSLRVRDDSELKEAEQLVQSKETPRVAVSNTVGARLAARSNLVQIRLRAYETDRESLSAAVWSFAVMRDPILTQADVDPRTQPKDRTAGTGLYSFKCHGEDVDQIQQLASAMLGLHSIDMQAARSKASELTQPIPKVTPPWLERP